MADAVGVHIEAGGAGAAVDGGVEDGVQGTGGAGSLEGELVVSAGEDANSTGILGVSWSADTFATRYDLV